MRQVLFRIPIPFFDFEVPIFGYGMMLFLAFVACMILASRRAYKAGISPERVFDMAIWIFIFGILGARITYMIQYHVPIEDFIKIWEGGLVFYGSAIGGVVGYGVAYVVVLRKYHLSSWKMADIAAPCIALGLCLGRLGCYLNGCCYGNVACKDCPASHFPLSSQARYYLVSKGYQTAAGFITKENEGHPLTVDRVERGSPAWDSGLRPGDKILKIDGKDLADSKAADPLASYLDSANWPQGKTDLQLTVSRKAIDKPVDLPAFTPVTLGLHPTQLYESISMFLLMLLLLAYYPLRRHDGELAVILMLCYAVHRFLNEMLRNDTDPVAFGMTLSQNGSILIFIAGLIMAWWVWRQPLRSNQSGETPPGQLPARAAAAR